MRVLVDEKSKGEVWGNCSVGCGIGREASGMDGEMFRHRHSLVLGLTHHLA